jgi:hypothetical protein
MVMKAYSWRPFEEAREYVCGLDINDSTQKYTLQSMPGKFSGLHLICYEYVAFQPVAPEKDIGFDLSAEYRTALSLFEKKLLVGSNARVKNTPDWLR